MALPRRFLPPMHVLCAFEAAARLGSFTAAAAELNLTQSAVSRQIRMLEEMLDAGLFIRERQTVKLTQAGSAYAQEVRESLKRIANATLGFKANPHGGTLNLAILPTFGMRWLAPRLPRFIASNPGVTINLVTRLQPFDFQLENSVDAAIHYGQPDWPGAKLDFLLPETVVPACSRAMRDRYHFKEISDLLQAPLLHLVSRPDAWERWFAAQGLDDVVIHGMLLDQFALVTQAAIADLGVALLPQFLFKDEFARGDLVFAIDAPSQNTEAYYLACPIGKHDHPPLQAFRRWLQTEVHAHEVALDQAS
ncbi:LysR family transcriptional regulator [Lampropedia puyangensis]|uniref:LysR family transcriptional regulator n=1 Tax=Lampropedia puyangensis TaxID=1330072 RepID=A0A4S8FCD4_9BURK|nr:LysR family transcriptional regulator [Lampropedia puyangensis]THU05220.1 LysR family transcriptional regulator [Lampropedia puyangensis]